MLHNSGGPVRRMADPWSDPHSVHSGSKHLRIAHIIRTTDDSATSLDVDELADTACECLNRFHDRGMEDSFQSHLSKLEGQSMLTLMKGSKPLLRGSKKQFEHLQVAPESNG